VTVEEGCIMGGAGAAVSERWPAGINKPVLHLGLPDRFIDHGDPCNCWRSAGWMPMASRSPSCSAFGKDQPKLVVNNG
jgi:1-deoxy-D-xylulose-5-phosphate synthase